MTALFFGALLVVGLALLVITALRVLLGGIAESRAGADHPEDRAAGHETGGAARRVLDERYAAGELTTEEYRHRLRVLEGES